MWQIFSRYFLCFYPSKSHGRGQTHFSVKTAILTCLKKLWHARLNADACHTLFSDGLFPPPLRRLQYALMARNAPLWEIAPAPPKKTYGEFAQRRESPYGRRRMLAHAARRGEHSRAARSYGPTPIERVIPPQKNATFLNFKGGFLLSPLANQKHHRTNRRQRIRNRNCKPNAVDAQNRRQNQQQGNDE